MPILQVNNTGLYYEERGTGPETIVFAHGLLWSCRVFDKQVAELKNHYRCIAFDFRGHGKSEATKNGYDLDTLTEDAAGLIEALHCAPCHFVGLSMGSFVGIRLASRRPELIRSLTLLDTSADPEKAENIKRYSRMIFVARWLTPRLVTGRLMPVMFGKKFLTDPACADEKNAWQKRMGSQNRAGITRAAWGVAKRKGVRDELEKIRAPTLIMVGDQDVALPLDHSQRLHQGIPSSQLVVISGAGHTSTVEEPGAVNSTLRGFLSRTS